MSPPSSLSSSSLSSLTSPRRRLPRRPPPPPFPTSRRRPPLRRGGDAGARSSRRTGTIPTRSGGKGWSSMPPRACAIRRSRGRTGTHRRSGIGRSGRRIGRKIATGGGDAARGGWRRSTGRRDSGGRLLRRPTFRSSWDWRQRGRLLSRGVFRYPPEDSDAALSLGSFISDDSRSTPPVVPSGPSLGVNLMKCS